MGDIVRKACGAIVALSVLCGSHTRAAADVVPVKAVPPIVPVYDWTSVYLGVHAGYGKGHKEWTNSRFNYDVDGWLGGLQAGFNQQVGNWVFGIEGDVSWSRIDGAQPLRSGGPARGFDETTTASTHIDRIVTVAGRFGLAQDRWLVYVKAGAAWVHETYTFGQTIVAATQPVRTLAGTGTEDRFGATLGIGSEVELWGNWSFKSEYNYIHLPTGSVQIAGTQTLFSVPTLFAFAETIPQSIHLAKFGINYRFGPDAPPPISPSRPAPGYDWTGAWIGVQAGYGFGRMEWRNFVAPLDHFNVDGWLVGITTGANVQAGVFVLGVETEWLHSRIDGGATATITSGVITQTNNHASRVDWLSLNSVRIGFTGADRWLFYVKGGVALAEETHTYALSQDRVGGGSNVINLSGNALRTGYLAGVGVERAFLRHWSAKLEYNYINVRLQDVVMSGLRTSNVPPTVGTVAELNRFTFRQDLHLVKLGVNYHFNSFADVIAAKY